MTAALPMGENARRHLAGASVPHYSGCLVVVSFDDGRPGLEDDDADLQLHDGELLLSYWDDQGIVVLAGSEREPGRFELKARSRPRRGRLQREDARTFAGVWEQAGECGTLRVELPVDLPVAGTQEES